MDTVKTTLQQGERILSQGSSASARLDVQVLLAYVLDVERAKLYIYPERTLTADQKRRFLELVERRRQGEPVAYLIGQKEFYGLDFFVDRRVLIPRPETELLVETALSILECKLSYGQVPVVADIGTGSGAIPVTLAVKEPRLPYLYACDASAAALEVARHNCRYHHVEERVRLLQGHLLDPLPEAVDLLTANLPYVGLDEMSTLAPDVRNYEPHQALFSGPSGLDLLVEFCRSAKKLAILRKEAVILLEIGYKQREPLTQLLYELWPQATISCKQDYAGWDRLLQVQL